MKNQVAFLRDKYKISQEEFAKKLGISRQLLSEIENGKNDPRLGMAYKIKKFFIEKGERIDTVEQIFLPKE